MGNLLVLKNSDVMRAHLDPARVIDLVEASIADLSLGNADNPPKVANTPEARKMAISMLGRLKKAGTIGFKSYAEIPVTTDRVHIESTITLECRVPLDELRDNAFQGRHRLVWCRAEPSSLRFAAGAT